MVIVSNFHDLVHGIKNSSSVENAIRTYRGNFTTIWIKAIYNSKKELPVLDTSFDVNIAGKDVMTTVGISSEMQTAIWDKWELLDDDIKASWIIDWKNVDAEDPDEILSFLSVISNYILQY